MACHVPHPHVWAPPQHVMPPYEVPYSAIYSPRVVCTHPTVPIDERQLKREKRKHANKQSARRSRLRKQAETEKLIKRYETVKVENITLKSEMKQLMEDSEKLRVKNVALMENLNGSEVAHPERRV
ncbi:transcriptional activator TAF-1-like [Camellia sinensis]|uniref:transcriptional activator TAF-1-like n=1 Tax=Camellia sinensis TaxID=4442 RepID=UPI001036E6C4|nr:transcriptional activator TAF-1-like [Camellia sinensis]